MDPITEQVIANYGVKGAFAIILIWVWWDLRKILSTLTTQLAVVVDRVDLHEKRLDRIEDKQFGQ